ncbi:unnamed protein product [Xylocopa violacea]|uniref:Uncharacterized protein n=1 Tax=Xylocopa violacea TaxID=135666 RepID=A0ABP1NY96_XYLVO
MLSATFGRVCIGVPAPPCHNASRDVISADDPHYSNSQRINFPSNSDKNDQNDCTIRFLERNPAALQSLCGSMQIGLTRHLQTHLNTLVTNYYTYLSL